MKKRFFNATVGGYYVVSIILGIAMALTVSMTACDLWFHAYEGHKIIEEQLTWQYGERSSVRTDQTEQREKALAWKEMDAESDNLEMFRMYVPLYSIGYELYSMPGTAFRWEYFENYIPIFLMILSVIVVFLSVTIMEGKSANKAWRQKMLQATAIALLIILLTVAWQCVEGRMYGKWSYFYGMRYYSDITTWSILIPIILLIIPFLVLKKTRMRKEKPEMSQEAR